MPGLRLDWLQPLVLSSLRNELMTPEAVERFRNQFIAQVGETRKVRDSERAAIRRALAKEEKAIEGALRAVRDDAATKSIYEMLSAAEKKKEELEADLESLDAPAFVIPEDLAALYRTQVDALAEMLSDPEVVHRASEILGELINRIVIRHDEPGGHTAQIDGKLLGLLSLTDKQKAASYRDAASSLKLVAGA